MTPNLTAASKESQRIQALHDLSVLDTPPEERFDRLTRLARRVFDVPIALVSLVDSDRQWFKSRDGLEATQTPREESFCTHAIRGSGVMIVPDALADPRFSESPLVLGDPGIRFYAGQPIHAPGGMPIGTLCIIDRRPRVLSPGDQALLADLAVLVEREFAALRLATIDELTGLSNRRGFNMLARHALASCDRTDRPAALILFDLDGFKPLNDTLGHAAGDAALASFGADLLATYRESDVVARLGGDEFCVLLSGATADVAPTTLTKLAKRVASRNEGRAPVAHVRYSAGVATYDSALHESLADLLEAADAVMYHQKRSRSGDRSFVA
jgi:diguanylate cyclase (GGDEF)-like protein